MRDKNVGKIIYALRTRNNISQEKLARGLCSLSALSRIESCERVPDKMLLDALLQRLGKSPDKLESIITERDYKLYLYREKIQDCIIDKRYEEAEDLLNQYTEYKEAEEKVHKQYILGIRAILSEVKYRDIEKSKEYIEEAIAITMQKGAMEALENSLLSVAEIQLLLMKLNNYEDNDGNVWEALDKLNTYVRKHYTDEEELVKIYEKIAQAEGRILLERKQYGRVLEIGEFVLDLLGRNGILTGFFSILSMTIEALEHLDQPEKLTKMKKWEGVLAELFDKYEIHLLEGSTKFLFKNTQSEILLVNELIKGRRKAKGLTQEMLSENICTPENLSAIERGRRAPSIKHYDKFMEKLGMDKDFYNSLVSAEEFEMHELKRECNRLIYLRKYREAEHVVGIMKAKLDMNIPINKQNILFNETIFLHRKGELKAEDAMKRAVEALNLTFNYNDGNFRTDVVFSQNEVKILNFIGVLHSLKGDTENAIKIFQKVMKSYKTSKVSGRCHCVTNNLILSNLCLALEKVDRIEESIEVSECGIKGALQCERGNLLPVFLTNKACCYEKLGNKKACMHYLQQAFYISDIVQNEYFMNLTKSYYIERFGELSDLEVF